jgi:hypothetical protein
MDDSIKVYADQNSWPVRFRGPLDGAVQDCRWFAHLAREFQLEKRWRGLAQTWEGFCQDKLGYPSEFVEAVIAGVRALGEEAPIPIEEAAKVGRAERIAASKRLVQEEGKSLREAAKELGVHHDTVREDLRVSEVSAYAQKSDTPRKESRISIFAGTSPATAAQRIHATFGGEFAAALKQAL